MDGPTDTGISAQRSERIEGIISNLPMFRNTSRALLGEFVFANAHGRFVHRGSTVLRRGEPLPGLFAVGYGKLRISLHGHDGRERVLRLAEQGATFCDAAAMLARPSPIDVVALEDSLLILLPAESLHRLVQQDKHFAHDLIGILATRALEYLAEVESDAMLSNMQRLASYFLSLAEPSGTDGLWLARLPTFKVTVASRLGMKKETLSRLLRRLTDSDIISVRRREITILDRDRLIAIARSAERELCPPEGCADCNPEYPAVSGAPTCRACGGIEMPAAMRNGGRGRVPIVNGYAAAGRAARRRTG